MTPAEAANDLRKRLQRVPDAHILLHRIADIVTQTGLRFEVCEMTAARFRNGHVDTCIQIVTAASAMLKRYGLPVEFTDHNNIIIHRAMPEINENDQARFQPVLLPPGPERCRVRR